jgi:hypothetical protein
MQFVSMGHASAVVVSEFVMWIVVQVLIEQLLRNQSMPPPAHFDHLHRQGSGLADQLLLGRQPQDPRLLDTSGQHLSSREFEQLLLARQNHTSPSPFEQLLRQRQQEEQQQQVIVLSAVQLCTCWSILSLPVCATLAAGSGRLSVTVNLRDIARLLSEFPKSRRFFIYCLCSVTAFMFVTSVVHLQMMQFGLPVPQPHQTLEDMRVSGVWEVDEFGQFVKRTQSPAPMRTFEAFQHQQHHQQQQQQQHQRLQSQLSYPGQLQQEPQDVFGYDQGSLIDPALMEPRVPMNMYDPNLLRRERSASGLPGISQMDGELVAQIQELRQVQERQQQVEAAAAARVLGLTTNTGLEAIDARPKSGDRRMSQTEAPGNSALLPGLRWPIINNEAPQKQDIAHERNIFPQSLGLWGQEAHDYAVPEQMQGEPRSGTLLPDHVPILPTPSAAETPRSSVASTPPDPPHMLGNWSLSNLHSNDALTNTQSSDAHSQGGSAAALTQPGWKPAAGPKPKSLADIQQEEAAGRAGEKTMLDSLGQPTSAAPASSAGFGPWAAPSVSQPKSLREIQEEEAQRAAGQEAAQKAAHAQSSAGLFSQKSPGSRAVDPPAWGSLSANERGSSLFDAGDEQLVSQVSRKTVDLEASSANQAPTGQSTQTSSSQNTSAFDDSDFIEPKESKKNKKRAAKAKSTTPSGNSAAPAATAEVFQAVSPLISSKSTVARSVQVEASEESLPAPPPGPSLADFLNLGNEPATGSQPLPAWSSTPSRQSKIGKSLSLKEIQEAEKRAREEQERHNQMLQASLALKNTPPPSAKPITLMTRSGSGGAAWQRPGVTAPSAQPAVSGQQPKIPTNTASNAGTGGSRSRIGVFEDDDDLFWDYGQDAKMNVGAVKQVTKSEP